MERCGTGSSSPFGGGPENRWTGRTCQERSPQRSREEEGHNQFPVKGWLCKKCCTVVREMRRTVSGKWTGTSGNEKVI